MRGGDVVDPPTALRPLRPPVTSRVQVALISITLAYIGFDIAVYPKYRITPEALSVPLVATLAVSLVGWRTGIWSPASRRYGRMAILISAWVAVSAVADWNTAAGLDALRLGLWLVVLVPGLAALAADDRFLDAFVLGFVAGITIFWIASTTRILTTGTALDALPIEGAHILGVNRGSPIIRTALILPFIYAGVGPKIVRRLRWPLTVMGLLLLVFSEARGAVLGMLIMLLCSIALLPSVSARVRGGVIGALVVVSALTLISGSGGAASSSVNRLVALVHDDAPTTDSDEARRLAMRKAWHLAVEHPAFGVGPGQFTLTTHPVVNEARSRHVRDLTEKIDAHNTYASIMAETGFPGVALFIGMIGSLLVAGSKTSRSREVRGATAALATVAVIIFFGAFLGAEFFVALMLAVAMLERTWRRTISAADVRAEPSHTTSGSPTV